VTGYSPTFVARLRAGGHRLLHAQFGWQGILAVPLLEAVPLPVVVTFRGRDVGRVAGRPGVPNPWLASRRRRLFSMASHINAVSQELVDRLLEMGAPPNRVRVWRDGIEIPPEVRARGALRARGPAEPLRVVMAGRFVEKKGFEYGLEAFAAFVSAGHDARLTLVGDGGLRPAYEGLVRRLGVGERVELTGVLPQKVLLERIAGADIFMVPSVRGASDDREGVPNVLKEASARSVPVIGTRHGGIPEALVDGVTGIVVPERDPAALARALGVLAADPALRARMGTAGREKMMREYDVVRQVAELEDIYDEVLAGAAR
jgi:glycosyltransferase involved in cell wall biosynthesis